MTGEPEPLAQQPDIGIALALLAICVVFVVLATAGAVSEARSRRRPVKARSVAPQIDWPKTWDQIVEERARARNYGVSSRKIVIRVRSYRD